MLTDSQIPEATMPQLISFYKDLAANNGKPWFDANKERWLSVKKLKESLALSLLRELQPYDEDLKGLTLKDITYRIYQDMRFHDREPYKNWLGIYLCKKGKKSPYAGYYLHIEPHGDNYMLCAGLYNEDKPLVKSVREDIMCSGEDFLRMIREAKGWHLDTEGALKRVPQGYETDAPHSDLFRLKHYLLVKPLNEKYILSKDLPQKVARDFKQMVPWVKMLNRAVDFAIEEWGFTPGH